MMVVVVMWLILGSAFCFVLSEIKGGNNAALTESKLDSTNAICVKFLPIH